MRKRMIWLIVIALVGNVISLAFQHHFLDIAQPFIWLLGIIWFILFLAYVLVPAITDLVKEDNHD